MIKPNLIATKKGGGGNEGGVIMKWGMIKLVAICDSIKSLY
jgi:hypothetical protein